MAKVISSPATLVGGSLAGALLLAGYLGMVATREPAGDPAPPARAVPANTAATAGTSPEPALRQVAQVQPPAASVTCPSAAVSPARGAGDGKFKLDAALASGAQVEPRAFVVVAREAAQQGRVRDAEVALLAACHLAERQGGSNSTAVADLKSQIGEQYVALAAAEPSASTRDDLVQRASALFSESAIAYAAALGREASRTRMAERRLASLSDPATLRLARSESTAVMGAARPSGQDEPGAAQVSSRGAAAAQHLISSDPELAQLERDMQRLHAQVSSVTRDPAGLRQRDSQAIARRDSGCHDKACLVRWYAQRRAQLLDEF